MENGFGGWYPCGWLKNINKFMEEWEHCRMCRISEVLRLKRVYQTQRDIFVVSNMYSFFFTKMWWGGGVRW
jgi:hypothetical protein